ncbi:MAG: hypothetical protein FWB95_01475 [Treponema sp.]|nr:hypothetical protein [Treponema sp.]
MKNKFVIVALIAAILVGGMVLVSCANPDCPGDGKCEYRLIGGSYCDRSVYQCFGANSYNYAYGAECACL